MTELHSVIQNEEKSCVSLRSKTEKGDIADCSIDIKAIDKFDEPTVEKSLRYQCSFN